jgi:hypothetical protein
MARESECRLHSGRRVMGAPLHKVQSGSLKLVAGRRDAAEACSALVSTLPALLCATRAWLDVVAALSWTPGLPGGGSSSIPLSPLRNAVVGVDPASPVANGCALWPAMATDTAPSPAAPPKMMLFADCRTLVGRASPISRTLDRLASGLLLVATLCL